MVKELFFLFVFVLLTNMSFAQADFREGFIINLSNDTVPGFINNRGNLKTLKKCRFKPHMDSDFIDYSPDDIQAFRIFDGGYYVSMDIDRDGQTERVFIEKLVEGIIDVYFFSALNEGYYLMETEDEKLYELKNSKIEVTNDDGTYLRDKKEYIYALRYLMQDSPKSVRKLDNLSFSSNAMIDIAQAYHNDVCEDYDCIVYTKEKIKAKLSIGMHAGYSISSITVFRNDFTENLNKDYSSSRDLVFGAFLNFLDPNISERFSVQLGMHFQKGFYLADQSSMEILFMKIPFSVKYTYPGKKVLPSLILGLGYNKWLDFEDKYIVPEHLSGDAIQKNKHQFGLYSGVEFAYRLSTKVNFFVNGKYELYKGNHTNIWSVPALTVKDLLSSRIHFISFSAGLQF